MGPNALLSYSIKSDTANGIVQAKVTAESSSWSSNVIQTDSKNSQL